MNDTDSTLDGSWPASSFAGHGMARDEDGAVVPLTPDESLGLDDASLEGPPERLWCNTCGVNGGETEDGEDCTDPECPFLASFSESEGSDSESEDPDIARPRLSQSPADLAAMAADLMAFFAKLMAQSEGRQRRHWIYRIAGSGDGRISGPDARARRIYRTARRFGLCS